MPDGPSPKSPLRVVFLTVLIDLLGFGMVIPILPLYAEKMHATDGQIGRLLAVYSLAQLIFAPIWGRVSDKIGRRPVLLVSIAGSCVSQLGYALAPSFGWLIVARALAGVCGANISAAQAYVADVTDARSRAAGMGMIGAAFGIGFVFGPAVGGLMSHHIGERAPFLAASGLAAINFVWAAFVLVEPRRRGERAAARSLSWSALVRTISTGRLMALIALFFIVTFGFANLESTFSLFLKRRYHFDRGTTSYIYAFIGVVIAVVQGVVLRRLGGRVPERALVIGGTAMMAAGLGVLFVSTTVPVLLLACVLVAAGNAFNTPSLSSLISRAAGAQQGGVLGVTQSFGALARIAGPIFGTWTLAYGVGIPYLTAGIVLVAASLFATAFITQPDDEAPLEIAAIPP